MDKDPNEYCLEPQYFDWLDQLLFNVYGLYPPTIKKNNSAFIIIQWTWTECHIAVFQNFIYTSYINQGDNLLNARCEYLLAKLMNTKTDTSSSLADQLTNAYKIHNHKGRLPKLLSAKFKYIFWCIIKKIPRNQW